MKLNNKGFTLIELLGVLVVLVAVLLVAVPKISSTFEKNKKRIDEQKKEVILSAGEIYASRYKDDIDYDDFLEGNCGIFVSAINEKGLLTVEELLDSNGKELKIQYNDGTIVGVNGVVIKYNKESGKYVFANSNSCYKLGDVNRDGSITDADLDLLLLRVVGRDVNFDDEQLMLGDLDNDGLVTGFDSICLSQFIDGMVNSSCSFSK